jgi:predicted dehydrogenase
MIRIALVGCGGMANWHAQVLQKIADAKVVALMDCNAAQTKAFREKYFPDAIEYGSYEAMLAKADALDAVVLVTPHTLHYPQAKAALEAGLHVLVEKPMVTNLEHAYDLWKTVKRTGKVFGISIQAPYTREFGYLARERDAGRLGRVQLISGWLAQDWMKNTRDTWRQDPALSGGGQMYDSGAHMLNAIMWLMNDPVVEVACFYDRCDSPVDINGVAIAKFQNGVLAAIAIGGNCGAFQTSIQIQTDRMLIVTDQYGRKLEITVPGRTVYPHVPEDDRPAAGTPHLNFIEAIHGREQLRAPVRYGVLLSALMDAMYESADTGKPMTVTAVPDDIAI